MKTYSVVDMAILSKLNFTTTTTTDISTEYIRAKVNSIYTVKTST